MAGLLYKDFAVIRGKLLCIGLIAVWFLLVAVQLLVPKAFLSEISYLCFGAIMWMIILMYVFCLTKLETGILAAEEGRCQKQYFLSLPIEAKDYVKSKYIFVLISFYVALSASVFLLSTCLIGCRDEQLKQMIYNVQSILPIITGMILFVPALEMPFFIGYGVQKGNQIKIGIMIALFFALMIWFLFGDLTVLDRIGLDGLFRYLQTHMEVLFVLQTLIPIAAGGAFYLSYRISARIFIGKEWEDD